MKIFGLVMNWTIPQKVKRCTALLNCAEDCIHQLMILFYKINLDSFAKSICTNISSFGNKVTDIPY